MVAIWYGFIFNRVLVGIFVAQAAIVLNQIDKHSIIYTDDLIHRWGRDISPQGKGGHQDK
jgi:hypothetical protein